MKTLAKYLIRKASAFSVCWAGTLVFLFQYVSIRCFILCAHVTIHNSVFVLLANTNQSTKLIQSTNCRHKLFGLLNLTVGGQFAGFINFDYKVPISVMNLSAYCILESISKRLSILICTIVTFVQINSSICQGHITQYL